MRPYIRITAILGIVLPVLASCRTISNFLLKDQVVAEVGKEKLFRSDLDALIPDGLTYDDSLRLSRQYINAWASDIVYVTIAQEQLSKTERDVTKELEEYRKSLLKYRYEQLYVNERLDTAVSDDMVEEYYNSHKETFRLDRPLVKARFMKIHSNSPMLEVIRKKMQSQEPEELMEADSLAFSSAVKFTTWDNLWQDVIVLARELGVGHDEVLELMRDGWIRQDDTTGFTSLAYISEIVRSGEYAPLDYASPNIKDIIISTRKQSLIYSLEQDLLKEARESGKFVIY